MSWDSDMSGFKNRFISRADRVVLAVGQEVLTSIRDGSPITGSPGQPVDEGELYDSWTMEPRAPGEVVVTTKLGPKAWAIEHGVRAATRRSIRRAKKAGFFAGMSLSKIRRNRALKIQLQVRSPVGGFHSVKLTRAGFQRLVNVAVARLGP